jgi:hypothetical protein
MISPLAGFLLFLLSFFRSRYNLGLEIFALRRQLSVLKRRKCLIPQAISISLTVHIAAPSKSILREVSLPSLGMENLVTAAMVAQLLQLGWLI